MSKQVKVKCITTCVIARMNISKIASLSLEV